MHYKTDSCTYVFLNCEKLTRVWADGLTSSFISNRLVPNTGICIYRVCIAHFIYNTSTFLCSHNRKPLKKKMCKANQYFVLLLSILLETSEMNHELLVELLWVCCHFTARSRRLPFLFFCHCQKEQQQSSSNKYGPEEKLLIFCNSALISYLSLKALVSTGGKNVQAACDWWEQHTLSLTNTLQLLEHNWNANRQSVMVNIDCPNSTKCVTVLFWQYCHLLDTLFICFLPFVTHNHGSFWLYPSPQAIFPRGWPLSGRPSAKRVCALSATQWTVAPAALALLAAVSHLLWQKQGTQHLPPHHSLPVLHGQSHTRTCVCTNNNNKCSAFLP